MHRTGPSERKENSILQYVTLTLDIYHKSVTVSVAVSIKEAVLHQKPGVKINAPYCCAILLSQQMYTVSHKNEPTWFCL